MELDNLPADLLVLGGGYIGLEFGQMFRRFGSRVTIIQRTGQLLGREDQDVAEAVLDVMKEDGIDVLLNTEAVRVQKDGTQIELTVRTANGEQTLSENHVLVAVGRKPNNQKLKLFRAGNYNHLNGKGQGNPSLRNNNPRGFAP